jgi:elongation factor Ts
MAEITTETIKALRDQTGVSVMQCKKALEEAGGDTEKALVILRKKSSEIAAKKGDRALGSGAVATYVHSTGTIAAMVLLSSETDFVSKNEEFRKLAYDIAMHIAASNPQFLSKNDIDDKSKETASSVFAEEIKNKPKDLQEKILAGKLADYFKDRVLLDQPYIKNPDITIQGLIDAAVQKFGERIEVSKFVRFSV